MNNDKVDIIYTKVSDYRDERYNLKTEIVLINGIKYVKKEPITTLAYEHINNIYRYEKRLKDIFEPDFSVAEVKKSGNGLVFQFIDGDSLESILDDYVRMGLFEQAIELINDYHKIVFKMKTGDKFMIDEKFKSVFGSQEFSGDIAVGKFVDIDLILSNIIVGKKKTIIDYEWCLDCDVPLYYIFWKGLFTSKAFSRLPSYIKNQIFNKYDINDNLQKQFLNMEEHFVNHAKGNKVSFDLQASKIFPSTVGYSNLVWDGKNYPVTIWGRKNGEATQFGKAMSFPGGNCVDFDVDNQYDRIEVFIAPVASIITDLKVYGINKGQLEEIPFHTTSEADTMSVKFFLKNTPVVIIENTRFETFRIVYNVNVWNSVELGGDSLNEYLNSTSFTCEQSIHEIYENRRLIDEKDLIIREKELIESQVYQKSFIKALIRLIELRKINRIKN